MYGEAQQAMEASAVRCCSRVPPRPVSRCRSLSLSGVEPDDSLGDRGDEKLSAEGVEV
jgi:hypothetical protein